MALETANTINQLDPSNPSGPDRLAQGDDHIRLIKQALRNTFPNISGPMTLTQEFLNSLAGGIVPIGTINLWAGTAAQVPAGYAICNGQTVNRSDGQGTITTPDLRGRVPVGLSGTQTPGDLFGQSQRVVTSGVGGGHTHAGSTAPGEGGHSHSIQVDGTALTVAQIPSHTHNIRLHGNSQIAHDSSSEGDRTVQNGGGTSGGFIEETGGGQPHSHTASISGNGAHQHSVAIGAVADHAHSVTVDVTQPSMALHYIMRV